MPRRFKPSSSGAYGKELRRSRGRWRQRVIIFSWLAAVAVITGVVYFLFFSSWFYIANIQWRQQTEAGVWEQAPKETVLTAVNSLLDQRYRGVISWRNYWFWPAKKLQDQLNQFEFYSNIKIERPNFRTAIITYHPKSVALIATRQPTEPVLVVKGDNVTPDYFGVSADGVIIDQQPPPELAGKNQLLVQIQSPKPWQIGDRVMLPERPLWLEHIKLGLPLMLGQEVKEFHLDDDFNNPQVKIITRSGWQIWLLGDKSVEEALEPLWGLWQQRIKNRSLEYIDLRVPGRAYIKYKNTP